MSRSRFETGVQPGFEMIDQDHTGSQKPGLRQIVGSVLAAGLGVQSEKNRHRDFQHGSARDYILVGIVATILFIAAIMGIVKLVLGGFSHP